MARGPIKLEPIGIIHSPFTSPEGAPIQPAVAKGVQGRVELEFAYVPALQDLARFERVWLLYWFDRASAYRPTVVPFLDTVERGLFATRAPCRPNPIGISAVRLLRIEDNILHIADVDILDGTPLLDIKPYAPRFDCFEIKRSGWLDGLDRNEDTGRELADDRFDRSRKERDGS